MWKILDTGVNSAQKNMDIDAALLSQIRPNDPPLLHFYDWEQSSGTYGYFLNIKKFLDLEKARSKGLCLARRPTGGGIIFHFCDLVFSAIVPSTCPGFSPCTIDNYRFINNYVRKAVEMFFHTSQIPALLPRDPSPSALPSSHFCMAKPTIYDVMIGGKKIAGAAQRRQKQGYLHQGSIAIALPEQTLQEVLLPGAEVIEAIRLHSLPILKTPYTQVELQSVRRELRHLLIKSFGAV